MSSCRTWEPDWPPSQVPGLPLHDKHRSLAAVHGRPQRWANHCHCMSTELNKCNDPLLRPRISPHMHQTQAKEHSRSSCSCFLSFRAWCFRRLICNSSTQGVALMQRPISKRSWMWQRCAPKTQTAIGKSAHRPHLEPVMTSRSNSHPLQDSLVGCRTLTKSPH